MKRIVELDGIRAFAILMVITHHYYPFTVMLYGLPEFGWVGVELFFVLSGFLITSILLQLKERPHPYKIFYARRILRIFPPYYAVFILVLSLAMLQGDHFSWSKMIGKIFFLQSFGESPAVFAHILHTVQGNLSFPDPFIREDLPNAMHGFFVHGGFSKSFVPTWSLSIEEWFYILWAPMVLHFRQKVLGSICIITCILALAVRWFGFLGFDTYFDFFSRIDVLMGGALLALWVEHRRELPKPAQERCDSMLLWISAACALLLAVILYTGRPVIGREIRNDCLFMVFGLPLITLGFSGLLNHIIKHGGSNRRLHRVLRIKPLVAIGTISYTLYLVHVPVLFLVNEAAAHLRFLSVQSYTGSLVVALTSFLCSLSVASLSFRYFESPILKYKNRLSGYFSNDRALSDSNFIEDASGIEQHTKRTTVQALPYS
ncbi:MAG: acyltransferase [Silvibacterium sp.]|nr:acyltransferase [Silvibacterium sp.]